MAKDLTPKQKRFVEEYIVDLNATRAAIAAGYSESSAKQIASENLSKPDVQEAIQAAMEARSKRVEITADTVLKRLDQVGGIDIGKLFDDKGRFLHIHDIPEEIRCAIASIKVYEEYEGSGQDKFATGVVREIKFWDKIKANELIGKSTNLGMFTDNIKLSGSVTISDRLAKARKRVRGE